MIRNDIHPSCIIPEALQECLLRVGGKNLYGEPMFRLLLAQDRVTKAAGVWNIWPDSASLDDRSGLGINEAQEILLEGQRVIERMQKHGCTEDAIKKVTDLMTEEVNLLFESGPKQPEQTIEGMYDAVPLYHFEGFILEKWRPPHWFGTPDEWNAYSFQGMPALGPYPATGDYEYIAGPTPHMPTEEELTTAIKQHFRELQEKGSPRQRLKNMLDVLEKRRQQKIKDLANLAQAWAKDRAPLFNRLSLGAGRFRQELAEKAGLKGHYGN